VIYLDSSVLLEVYLTQPRRNVALGLLARPGAKVSSYLLSIETAVVLRRSLGVGRRNRGLLRAALARLAADLEGISLVDGLADIADRVRRDASFARCRALDAIHAATALQLRELSGRPVQLATLDAGLAELARALGLEVLPSPPG
jgi:predicted nucleic acid-binding protein